MPWNIKRRNNKYCVYTDSGELVYCHTTAGKAAAQLRALYASEEKSLAEIIERCTEDEKYGSSDLLVYRHRKTKKIAISVGDWVERETIDKLRSEFPGAEIDAEWNPGDEYERIYPSKSKEIESEKADRNYGATAGQTIAGNLVRGSSGKFQSGSASAISNSLDSIGVGKAELSALTAFNKGGELDAATGEKLAGMGLVKVNADGSYSRAAAGQQLLAAVRKNDVAKIRDIVNAAANKPGAGGKKPKGGKTSSGGAGKPDKSAERINNMGKVRDQIEKAGMSKEDFDSLAKYAAGDDADEAAVERLVGNGLLERGMDGLARMTRHGNALLAAAERGDVRKSSDAVSTARDEVAKKRGEANAAIRRSTNLTRKECFDVSDEMMEGGYIPYNGAVTFEEIDAMERAETTSEIMDELTEQFNMLSRNVMQNPMVTDKGAALKKLAQEYAVRVDMAIKNPVEKSLEAEDEKAVWTTKYVNTLPDSAFMYIAPGGEKDDEGKTVPRNLRHFVYRDAEGKVDLPHLRNAIARIPQSTAEGLTAEKMTQLQDRARKMLEEANAQKEMNFIERIVNAVKEVFVPKAAKKPYRVQMTKEDLELMQEAMGEDEPESFGVTAMSEDSVDFEDEEKAAAMQKKMQECKGRCKKEGLVLWKERESGPYRWFATYSNHFRDRDNPPEILSSESHKEFIAAVDAGEVAYPELWHWHMKGTTWGKADWMAYDEETGFSMACGYVLPGHEKEAEVLAGMDDVKVSHGMNSIARDFEDKSIIKRYRTVEISALPGFAAANELTSFNLEMENSMIPEGKKEYLRKIGMSEDKIAQIEQVNKERSQAAMDAGIEYKEADMTETATHETVIPDYVTREEIADAVANTIKPLMDAMTAMSAVVEAQTKELAALKEAKATEDKERKERTPRASLSEIIYARVAGNKEAQLKPGEDLGEPVEKAANEQQSGLFFQRQGWAK